MATVSGMANQARITPADPSLKIPHMGWNTLNERRSHPLLEGIAVGPQGLHAYFVHSFHLSVAERSDRSRSVVSHFNKAYKGKLAGVLATIPREPSTVDGLLRVISKAGLRIERTGPHELEMLTDH